MRRLILGMACAGWAVCAWGATAPTADSGPSPGTVPNAPGETPAARSQGTAPGPIPNPAADSSQGLWERSSLLGDLDGIRPALGARGIAITPVYTGEVMGNFLGGAGGYDGRGHGVVYDQSLDVPLDIDFSKLVPGWEGGSFHVSASWLAGPGLSPSYTGDFSNTSAIQGFNTVRLDELWFQQTFCQQLLSLKVGEIAADSEFFDSSTASVFVNSTFGTFTLVANNLTDPHNSPIYPLAAPAVRLIVQPLPQFAFQCGVFDGNSESQPANSSGTAFPLNAGSGVLLLAEAAYLVNQQPNDQGLQATYKLGTFVHTGDFAAWNPQSGERGTDYGIYGIVDQQLYSRNGKTIAVFLQPGYAPPGVNLVEWYAAGGINLTGFVPGRAADVMGVAMARSQVSGDYSHAQATLTGNGTYSAETVVEATYKVTLSPWWSVQPDFQYIFTPSGRNGSPDAAVLGLRTSVAF